MNELTSKVLHEHAHSRVLLRVDYNIPIKGTKSVSRSELYRIESSLDTIFRLQSNGIAVVLATHFGREGESLNPLVPYIARYLPVRSIESWAEVQHQTSVHHDPSTVLLLPNLRSHKGEESNDPAFAQLLASTASWYINDAFSVSHRRHASIAGVPELLPSYAGAQFVREVKALSHVRNPEKPAIVIIGGAKFDTKLTLITEYLTRGAEVAVVGALAHAIYRARGYEIGTSTIDTEVSVVDIANHPNLWVPSEVVVEPVPGASRLSTLTKILPTERIVDASFGSVCELGDKVVQAKTVIWNGPLGWYEGGYKDATNTLKNYLKASPAFRVVGGGDTVALIGVEERAPVADFISTGGGAMLDFLTHGTLPGLELLKNRLVSEKKHIK